MTDLPNTAKAREALFKKLQRAGLSGTDEERRMVVKQRLSNPRRNLVPQRALGQKEELVGMLQTQLEAVDGTVAQVSDPAAAGDELERYLAVQDLPRTARCGNDPLLKQVMAAVASRLTVSFGPAALTDLVSLTRAFAAAAETGTLFLASGPANPVSLSYLPETNIVLVRREDIFGSYEQAFDKLRDDRGAGDMPRTLNLISGPSRTADIEQTLITGAHGPKRLHVIVVG
jgi:L-lactate dehydrogenase complex protein LldG